MLTVIVALGIVLATLALRTLLERGYTPTGTFAAGTIDADAYRTTAVTRP